MSHAGSGRSGGERHADRTSTIAEAVLGGAGVEVEVWEAEDFDIDRRAVLINERALWEVALEAQS